MTLQGEARKEYMRNYKAALKEKKQAAAAEMSLCEELDKKDIESGGKRYKAECRSYAELARLYYGISVQQNDDEEDEAPKPKKKDGPKPLKPVESMILGRKLTFWEWLDTRDQARSDLFWFGQTVQKKDLIPEVHQVICDQFVKKDFKGTYHEGYTVKDVQAAFKRQNRARIAVILDQRGGYKSTINMLDAVQWMINAPDCRIIVLTETFKLAKKFRRQFKEYFSLKKGAKPTDFHLLFPEYVLRGVKGTSEVEYFCPAAIIPGSGDPNLSTASVESAVAGFHCDIMKMDDAISDKNSRTDDLREQVRDIINLADELLDSHGFKDIIGTRYFGGQNPDYYGYLLKLREKGSFNFQYFCRGCWVVKEGFESVPLPELTEDMVICSFPQKFSFKVLKEDLHKNQADDYRNFRNQKLNEPIDSEEASEFKISFPLEDLWKHTYGLSAAPKEGDIYIAWDWAYTVGKSSDYSAGVCGRIYRREDGEWGISVLEVICDKWTPTELAFQIVMFNRKWNPKRTLIEKTICADLLKMEIIRRAQMHGAVMDIYWKQPDQHSDAKRNRIKSLEIKFKDNLLWFVHGIRLDLAFKQFSEYVGDKVRRRHDDIPDAVSLLACFLPRTDFSTMTEEELQSQTDEALRMEQYNRVFGTNSIVRQPNVPQSSPAPSDPRARYNIPGLRLR